jgi:hypothetical protein
MDTSCRGLAPTIVGDAGSLVGMDGPDVMLALGSAVASGLGGDDVICLAGSDQGAQAGQGNDVVDTAAALGFTDVSLGAGQDSFVGGSANDEVWGAVYWGLRPGPRSHPRYRGGFHLDRRRR